MGAVEPSQGNFPHAKNHHLDDSLSTNKARMIIEIAPYTTQDRTFYYTPEEAHSSHEYAPHTAAVAHNKCNMRIDELDTLAKRMGLLADKNNHETDSIALGLPELPISQTADNIYFLERSDFSEQPPHGCNRFSASYEMMKNVGVKHSQRHTSRIQTYFNSVLRKFSHLKSHHHSSDFLSNNNASFQNSKRCDDASIILHSTENHPNVASSKHSAAEIAGSGGDSVKSANIISAKLAKSNKVKTIMRKFSRLFRPSKQNRHRVIDKNVAATHVSCNSSVRSHHKPFSSLRLKSTNKRNLEGNTLETKVRNVDESLSVPFSSPSNPDATFSSRIGRMTRSNDHSGIPVDVPGTSISSASHQTALTTSSISPESDHAIDYAAHPTNSIVATSTGDYVDSVKRSSESLTSFTQHLMSESKYLALSVSAFGYEQCYTRQHARDVSSDKREYVSTPVFFANTGSATATATTTFNTISGVDGVDKRREAERDGVDVDANENVDDDDYVGERRENANDAGDGSDLPRLPETSVLYDNSSARQPITDAEQLSVSSVNVNVVRPSKLELCENFEAETDEDLHSYQDRILRRQRTISFSMQSSRSLVRKSLIMLHVSKASPGGKQQSFGCCDNGSFFASLNKHDSARYNSVDSAFNEAKFYCYGSDSPLVSPFMTNSFHLPLCDATDVASRPLMEETSNVDTSSTFGEVAFTEVDADSELTKRLIDNCHEHREPYGVSIQEKDGSYFMNVLNEVATELRTLLTAVERDLENSYLNKISEEMAGHMRTTVGKGNLLLNDKFAQFGNLCKENLAMASNSSSNGYVTLNSDLDGFWAMVLIQVDDVRAMLRTIDVWRQRNWQWSDEPVVLCSQLHTAQPLSLSSSSRNRTTAFSRITSAAKSNNLPKNSEINTSRKRFLAEKRKMMKSNQHCAVNPLDSEVLIFT